MDVATNIINLHTDQEKALLSDRKWEHMNILLYSINDFLKKFDITFKEKPIPDDWFPILTYRGYIYDVNWLQPWYTRSDEWERPKECPTKIASLRVNYFYAEFRRKCRKNDRIFVMRERVNENQEIYTLVFLKNNTYLRYLIKDFKKFTEEYKVSAKYYTGEFHDHWSRYALNKRKPYAELLDDYYQDMIKTHLIDITHKEITNNIIKHIVQERKLEPKKQKVIKIKF